MQSGKYSALFSCIVVAMLVSSVASTPVEKRCVDRMTYNDGCNTCFCARGRILCTLVACSIWDESLQMHVPKPALEPPADFWEPVEAVEPQRA